MRTTTKVHTSTHALLVRARQRRRVTNIRPTHGTTGCRDVAYYRPLEIRVPSALTDTP